VRTCATVHACFLHAYRVCLFPTFRLDFSFPPPPYDRPPLPALYLVRPLFCPVVSLLLLFSLPLSRYLELSSDVGLDGTASFAVFEACSRYYLPTGPPTCVAAAVGTWSAMMGASFGCPHGRSPSRRPSRNTTEQHQRAVCMGRQLPVIAWGLAQ